MLKKVNIILISALLISITFRTFGQSNSGSSPTAVSSINGTRTVAGRTINSTPVENKSAGISVKEINKKKRKPVHVSKVKKDTHAAKKAVR